MEHGAVRVISKVSPSILQNNHQHAGQETNPLSSSTVICGVSGTDDSLSAWFKRASDVTEPDTVYFSLLCLLHSLNASLEKKNRRKASHCNASCFLKKGNQFLLELRMYSIGPGWPTTFWCQQQKGLLEIFSTTITQQPREHWKILN